MDRSRLLNLLEQVASGAVEADAAVDRLVDLPFEDLGFAHVDHHRAVRTGFPEVIFCQGKTTDQVVGIANAILNGGSIVLATRVPEETAHVMADSFPGTEVDDIARTVVVRPRDVAEPTAIGNVLILSAGTSDLPVAQEALVTCRAMGSQVEGIFDVGVAGIHRLLAYREKLQSARVLVVVAGMEGALPSVVGGLVQVPVIAVPTSVGYGASLNGLAALLAMLNSCASGITVVNIDNGFGAGYAAALINRLGVETG
jgi:NCAIR mutase (PurE)-related protein